MMRMRFSFSGKFLQPRKSSVMEIFLYVSQIREPYNFYLSYTAKVATVFFFLWLDWVPSSQLDLQCS